MTTKPHDKDAVEMVQKAATVLKETIEKYLGEKAVVKWGASQGSQISAGVTITEGMARVDFAGILLAMDEVQFGNVKFK